jgi:hypothetical protein
MTNVTTAQLAEMRRQAEALMRQTCTITRISPTPDGLGGWSESTSTVAEGVPCRLAVAGAGLRDTGLRVSAGRVAGLAAYDLKVPHDQDLAVSDLVTVNGETFRVEEVRAAHQWATVKRASLSKEM